MGVGRYTPEYLIRKELQKDKLRERADMRVWEYEKKLGKRKGGNWLEFAGWI